MNLDVTMHGIPRLELAELDLECQRLGLQLPEHPGVARLGNIRQLGFATAQQQTRLHHTLQSVELAAKLVSTIPNVSNEAKLHVLAAVALEDVGRAPFSNSLEGLFSSVPGAESGPQIDVRRTVAVIEHLERQESILSRHGISPQIVTILLNGKVPFVDQQSLLPILNGPADIDRLQYVRGDAVAAGIADIDLAAIVRGIVSKNSTEVTVLQRSSLDTFLDFVIHRTQLCTALYFEPGKLAAEHVVSVFFRNFWNWASSAGAEWLDTVEPRSVEEFLTWTDSKVLETFEGRRWNSAREDLLEFRELLINGELQVAEIRRLVHLIQNPLELESLIVPIRAVLAAQKYCWIIDGHALPRLQAIVPGTVVVENKGKFKCITELAEIRDNPDLIRVKRPFPLIVFRSKDFQAVQSIISEMNLVFGFMRSVDAIQRFRREPLPTIL